MRTVPLQFPGVEEVRERFADEATFVAVYVREAHPTDGWRHGRRTTGRASARRSRRRTTSGSAVATECHKLLKYEMPLLVDEINDPVGHAYSGMPARLYVIDRAGNVAYKSGRGPFGFKPARDGAGAGHDAPGAEAGSRARRRRRGARPQ